jgi:hypothetical protein
MNFFQLLEIMRKKTLISFFHVLIFGFQYVAKNINEGLNLCNS